MLQEKIKNARRITIMGLGTYPHGSGISTALFFAQKGAQVLVTDLKEEKELRAQIKKLQKYKNVCFILGRHRKQDFINTDLVFQNPLVPDYSPYIQIARENEIPVINDWTIFLSLCDNVVVGVTGTKGKSTTASLIYEFLKAGNVPAVLCGNIGDSPLKYLLSPRHSSLGRNTVMVAELSSWLLRGFKEIKKSPHIAVITNLLVDHQDKYKSLKAYYRDKENIFKYQTPADYLILNRDDSELRKRGNKAKSQVYWFSKNTSPGDGVYCERSEQQGSAKHGSYIQGNSIYFQASERKVNGNFTFPSERRKQGPPYFQNNKKRKKICSCIGISKFRYKRKGDGETQFHRRGDSEPAGRAPEGGSPMENIARERSERLCSVSDIKIKGAHNLENVLAAILAALLYGIDPVRSKKPLVSAALDKERISNGVDQKAMVNVLKTFTGIPYRLEFVREVLGVKYYNDTAATSPDATIAALNSFKDKKGKIILIGGGHDKKLDYKEYVKEVNKYVKALILFKGTATDKIFKKLRRSDLRNFVVIISSMKQAVEQAKTFAQKGDIVLLSPGAASYGVFKNE
ncbi:UDP-N-acetylmuramoyl-L-alanine--D-glutamate ligase, partial [Patescibacteria group bacterium AH-259-L07]|nr:UDP-N-acetylmuramoyl-L-alanine--D-glutamate ligase [Patescibacteria group bacterium AH-259-L07]